MDNLVRPPFIQTPAYALAGIPALSVPCGFSPDPEGMPIGLHLGGRPYDEATILKVAHLYEQSSGWHLKRPSPDPSIALGKLKEGHPSQLGGMPLP